MKRVGTGIGQHSAFFGKVNSSHNPVGPADIGDFFISVCFRSVYLSEDFRDLGKMFHMDLKTEIKEGEEATLYPAIEQH